MTVPVTSIRKSDSIDAPAKQTTFEGVQILRGVAAAMVVFHHMCWVITSYHPQRSTIASFYRLAELGAGGVDIFFCISGLVIAHAARNLSPGIRSAATFAWRRLLRVLPPYWVFTLALVALWAVGFALRSLVMTPGLFVSSMLLIPWPKYSGDGVAHYRPILDVGWTLSFEMFFYALCAGVIAVGGGRRVWPWAPLLLALVAGSAFALGATPSVVDFSLASPMLVEFVFGVFIARYVAGRVMPALGWSLVAAGVAGLAASVFVADPIAARVLCWGVPGAALVAGLVLLPVQIDTRAKQAGAFFGIASYTIYLAHPFFTLVAGTLLKKGIGAALPPNLLLLVLTAVAVAGSAVAWFVVEKPLVQLLKPRSKTAAMAVEAAPAG